MVPQAKVSSHLRLIPLPVGALTCNLGHVLGLNKHQLSLFTEAVRDVARDVADLRLNYDEQDPVAMQEFSRQMRERFPILDRYEDGWPATISLRRALYASRRRYRLQEEASANTQQTNNSDNSTESSPKKTLKSVNATLARKRGRPRIYHGSVSRTFEERPTSPARAKDSIPQKRIRSDASEKNDSERGEDEPPSHDIKSSNDGPSLVSIIRNGRIEPSKTVRRSTGKFKPARVPVGGGVAPSATRHKSVSGSSTGSSTTAISPQSDSSVRQKGSSDQPSSSYSSTSPSSVRPTSTIGPSDSASRVRAVTNMSRGSEFVQGSSSGAGSRIGALTTHASSSSLSASTSSSMGLVNYHAPANNVIDFAYAATLELKVFLYNIHPSLLRVLPYFQAAGIVTTEDLLTILAWPQEKRQFFLLTQVHLTVYSCQLLLDVIPPGAIEELHQD
ncbi:hypothetical protein K474DRAFT_1679561 [Panus rudis PR-1116 ss-1]|nr:hypothetical protein K474DRAFT_1679561 [Panus rudis PR-1116 ss-1]